MSIDFSELALSPNESRAARNFLGLSQAQTADQSGLPSHKLKRFETGNYVPDSEFLEKLREFFEDQGYNFHDENAPGAKAKARGDVFPSGVVGGTVSAPEETGSSPSEKPGKLSRERKVLQYMRITPDLDSDQIDRVFGCIEDNESTILNDVRKPVIYGFLAETPNEETQAQAVALLRRLAENGLLYARLMGRDLLPPGEGAPRAGKSTKKASAGFFATGTIPNTVWKTVGELLTVAMADVQLATVENDKEALARRKGRAEPSEVLQALVG
jgi:transcriptional regulator with XRE-family HTH domain